MSNESRQLPRQPLRRAAYTCCEFAQIMGREKNWIYRQLAKGTIRKISGFGKTMIPASEVDRITTEAAAIVGANQ